MTQETTANWDNDLVFVVHHYAGCPEKGESGYSLGQPAEDPCVEIERVDYQGHDITNFLVEYADNLLADWSGRLLEQLQEGRD